MSKEYTVALCHGNKKKSGLGLQAMFSEIPVERFSEFHVEIPRSMPGVPIPTIG